jgi:hypothetical protein
MNTSKSLDDLSRQGEIPRLLNQELKERKILQKGAEALPKMSGVFYQRTPHAKSARRHP